MAISPHDTNPAISTKVVREVLALENEIDKYLLEHLIGGKASYLVTASSAEVVDLLMKKFRRTGWTVTLGYSGGHLSRLEFEDPDQVNKQWKTSNPSNYTNYNK